MDSDKFQAQALTTESCDFAAICERMTDETTIRLLHAGIGMATEAGEFLDMLKKHIFYGKPIDRTNLLEEIGDGLWYDAIALDAMRSDFRTVMATIIAKLRARYPERFKEQDALQRDLDKERKILEGEVGDTLTEAKRVVQSIIDKERDKRIADPTIYNQGLRSSLGETVDKIDRAKQVLDRKSAEHGAKVCTTDGRLPDPDYDRLDSAPQPVKDNGQHGAYYVLCEEERAKGFVRPVRQTYRHKKCGAVTSMGRALAETYARDPHFYGATMCVNCGTHFPLRSADGYQFVWINGDGTDGEGVGEYTPESAPTGQSS